MVKLLKLVLENFGKLEKYSKNYKKFIKVFKILLKSVNNVKFMFEIF